MAHTENAGDQLPKRDADGSADVLVPALRVARQIVRGMGDTDAVAEKSRGPRVEELHNGEVHDVSGRVVMIRPDREVMQRIEQETSGKVCYFPTAEGIDISPAQRMGEPDFSDYVMEPLIAELMTRFPGKRLALRGVATSINGSLPAGEGGGYDLRDITETVASGTEKPGEVFNVAVLSSDGDSVSVHRVNQYASNVGFARKYEAGSHQEDAMFPAVLVYDLAGLAPVGDSSYGVSFKPEAKPSDVVLGAYVLDCPV